MPNSNDPAPRSLGRLEILDDAMTELGSAVLRRRYSLALEQDVYEFYLNDQLVMSNAVSISEQALAESAMERITRRPLRVLIGGLGFGFTALAALADARVSQVTVVERLSAVIEWHQKGLLPWSKDLLSDSRVRIVGDDFYQFLLQEPPSGRHYDVILVDIDDSPEILWHSEHARFYQLSGIRSVQEVLPSDGVYGLWSATPPDADYMTATRSIFPRTSLIDVTFTNPCLHQAETNYLILAQK